MANPKIAIIISSTREGRFADKPAQWLYDIAKQRSDIDVELVDLRDFPLPFFQEVTSPAYGPSQNEVAQRWQKKVAQFDGYLFLVAEYNRSITAALKNALDYSYVEWNRKAAAYFGYGSVGAARAIEHLRNISVELQMAPVRTGVHIGGGDFMGVWQQGKSLDELAYLKPNVDTMLDELTWWTKALKAARHHTEQGHPLS